MTQGSGAFSSQVTVTFTRGAACVYLRPRSFRSRACVCGRVGPGLVWTTGPSRPAQRSLLSHIKRHRERFSNKNTTKIQFPPPVACGVLVRTGFKEVAGPPFVWSKRMLKGLAIINEVYNQLWSLSFTRLCPCPCYQKRINRKLMRQSRLLSIESAHCEC